MLRRFGPTDIHLASRIAVLVGERLRRARLLAGLTQADLERRTGIQRPIIARIERGQHCPSIETVNAFALACRVAPLDVLRVLDSAEVAA